ncbi:hypothetical protein [uncultured Sphingomonas sp.]|uniref:hypothetical protein n=1 Tax=uncultured Sphingomonas sp. TaxID=158754 RepID=UPI002634652A|nr:hypothetical protein [uncultured Sphingomonas sp.]
MPIDQRSQPGGSRFALDDFRAAFRLIGMGFRRVNSRDPNAFAAGQAERIAIDNGANAPLIRRGGGKRKECDRYEKGASRSTCRSCRHPHRCFPLYAPRPFITAI